MPLGDDYRLGFFDAAGQFQAATTLPSQDRTLSSILADAENNARHLLQSEPLPGQFVVVRQVNRQFQVIALEQLFRGVRRRNRIQFSTIIDDESFPIT